MLPIFELGDFMGFFIGLLPAFLLLICGLLIKYMKAYWLISGYNTLSAEKKKNVNIEGLGRLMYKFCFIASFIVLVAMILMQKGLYQAGNITYSLILPAIIYVVIKAQKYDGNTKDCKGKTKKGAKIYTGFVIAFIIITIFGVGVLLFNCNIPAEYSIDNGVLSISGMYEEKIPFDEINNLELKEDLPKILLKTNGSALGNMYKGYFNLSGINNAKLFLNISKPPFIYVGYKNTIIFNCNDSEETKVLYERLQKTLRGK